MKLYVFNYIKSLKDYSDGHLVIAANNKEQAIQTLEKAAKKDKTHQTIDQLSITHAVHNEVKKIFDGETKDYRKPEIYDCPHAAAFLGSA